MRQALYPIVAFVDYLTISEDVQPGGDAYFESYGGWDYSRIALVEPYSATSIDKDQKIWNVQLSPKSVRSMPQVWVSKMDVIDQQVILLYAAGEHPFRGDDTRDEWYVIIPSQNIEKQFFNEQDFMSYLGTKGITKINMRDGQDLFQELVAKGCLEWYPQHWCK